MSADPFRGAMIAPPAISAREDIADACGGLADFARVVADSTCYLDLVERQLAWATGTAHEIAPLRADVEALVRKADAIEALVRGIARAAE